MASRLSGGPRQFDLRQKSHINVTPLVGVLLLLLVMVMVAAPAATVPPMTRIWTGPDSGVREPLFIHIEQHGRLYIETRPTSIATLLDDLDEIIGPPDATDEALVVRVHNQVPYSDFAAVLSTLKRGGYRTALLGEEL